MQVEHAHSRIDLHTHSTASDGLDSPAALVALARQRGLTVLGLTDHDSTEGLDEALAAGARHGVTVVPGVELGTDVPAGELHLLGYFIDHHQPAFQAALTRFREERRRRAERMVDQLRRIGVPVDLERVRALAQGGAIGRAHVARAMVEAGHATSVDDAFARFLVRGRPGYVPRPRLTPVEAVALVRRAGGAPVLAHPYSVADLEGELARLVPAGLAGLEVFYASYTPAQQAALARLAEQYGLIPSGGSDFHGAGQREGQELGSAPVPFETVATLRAAAGPR